MAVFYRGIEGSVVDAEIDQLVAGEVERNPVTGGHCNRTELGGDDAFVADFGGEQGDVATLAGVHFALVDNRAGTSPILETIVTARKVSIRKIER